MRILIIHTSYKIRGGEDSVVNNEKDLLISAGHEVNLLLFSNSGDVLSKLARLPFNYSSYKLAISAINDFKPDVIHIHNLHFAGSVSVLYAARKSKIPVVVTLHNYRLLCPTGTLFYNKQLFTDSIRRVFPWRAVKQAVYQNSVLITFWVALCGAIHQLLHSWRIPNQIIVLGENQKNIFLDSKYHSLAAKMVIKPNFCYPPAIEKKDSGSYYIYVGRLSTEKGIDMMLNSFSQLGLQLKIVGSGDMDKEVKEYAANHPNIEYLGIKDNKEINELLAGAAAAIFPSLWYETFGLVIIEAFACGTPVIGSAIGEPGYMITDHINSLLFQPGNENDLADKVKNFEALSTEQKRAMSEAARATYMSLYTPEKNIDRLEGIYKAALAQ